VQGGGRTRGTRAHGHRTTIEALGAFDEVNPQPMELGLNVRCGLCDRGLGTMAIL
jgi:hypothetical protein